MNPEIIQTAQDRAQANYLKRAGYSSLPVGFDPTLILTIITTILSLCQQPAKDIRKSAKSRTLQARVVVQSQVRQELRRKHGWFAYGKFDGDAITEAIFETAAESSEDEITAFAEACGVG